MTPRPRSFDEDTVLARAKDVFWRKGYEATSMQDLVDHMQIGRQSLYNTFGDKHTLFMRALGHYVEHDHVPSMGKLGQPGASLAEIEGFLDNLIERIGAHPDRRACFMVNAILELAPHDEAVRAAGEKTRLGLQQAFTDALQEARTRGELAEDVRVETYGLVLVHLTLGLTPLWKSGASIEELHTVRETLLAPLRPAYSANHQ
jgi:TetR/AcrR family transcriptional regulator, transcriptional repressor for nem operon